MYHLKTTIKRLHSNVTFFCFCCGRGNGGFAAAADSSSCSCASPACLCLRPARLPRRTLRFLALVLLLLAFFSALSIFFFALARHDRKHLLPRCGLHTHLFLIEWHDLVAARPPFAASYHPLMTSRQQTLRTRQCQKHLSSVTVKFKDELRQKKALEPNGFEKARILRLDVYV